MFRRPRSDFWQVGILPQSISSVATKSISREAASGITWLPDPGPWKYLADPFGVQRGDALHIFVEAFDYRTKHAVIEYHEMGLDRTWRGSSVAISQPFHLSYPFLVQDEGEIFLVPESHKANEIALYRARVFPNEWVRETVLLPGVAGADASLIRHEDYWWMFYTIVGPNARDQKELHIAHAKRLSGPWLTHPGNPVLIDQSGARPGGTPFIDKEGHIILPVQDCSGTYGGALRFLRFETLNPLVCRLGHLPLWLTGDLVSHDYRSGFHTLSSCEGFTLLDVKRIDRSFRRIGINIERHWRKLSRSVQKVREI